MNEEKLKASTVAELKKLIKKMQIDTNAKLKSQMIEEILKEQKKVLIQKNNQKSKIGKDLSGFMVAGCLDVMSDGYGFLRDVSNNYLQGDSDIYVSQSQIRRLRLRKGHMISGLARKNKQKDKYAALSRIDKVNGQSPELVRSLKRFEQLIPHFPDEKFVTDKPQFNVAGRIMSLFAPIGKGQRGLIVAAPRTGKTVLLQNISNTILKYNKVYTIVLLIDERPEEVTDMKETLIKENSEVVASTFDEVTSNHIQVAEMVIEKAKRMVEFGEDVVIMLDSITRLARAYNNEIPSSGKTLSGGIDVGALHYPKKFYGAARNITGGGSLTILATALVDTGSKMDQVIFEEFKGTGNMELLLDRSVSDARIYPAIDLVKSGTRREELLLTKEEMNRTFIIRGYLNNFNGTDGLKTLIENLKSTSSNEEFLSKMNR